MSKKAIYGIQEISWNVLLVCNTCVQNNQHDCVLDQITSTRERADVEAITLYVEEVKQGLAKTQTDLKAKPHPEPANHNPAWIKPQNQSITRRNNGVKENYDGICLRGIPESKTETGREQYDEDVEQVKQIFIFQSKTPKLRMSNSLEYMIKTKAEQF